MVSWDDLFMTKVKADLPMEANERHRTGLAKVSGGKQAYRQAQGAPKRSGEDVVSQSKRSINSYFGGTTGHRPVVW